MPARQLGIILCRVAAAVLIVQTLQQLGFFLPSLFNMNASFGVGLVGVLFVILIPGLAAAGLWFFAERICDLPALADSPTASLDSSKNPLDYLRVGTVLIGYYFLVQGLVWGARVELGYASAPDARNAFDAAAFAQRAAFVLQIVLGVALILGRDRLAALLFKAKVAGVK